jgi:PAS domain S-box-containing protein
VQRILGYADETMVKNLDVVFTPVTKRHVLKTFENFMKGYTEGDILVLGAEHRKKDGSLIWMEISASPLKDDFGKIVGFLGTSRNIAERKLAEEMLLESEIKYRRLFEAAKDGILILDAETGMIVDVNPFLVELLGYSSELFLGKTVWDIGFFKDITAIVQHCPNSPFRRRVPQWISHSE